MTKIHKKIGALFCVLAVILWYAAGMLMHVSAGETGGSLTLWCIKDEDIVSDMHWQIYRVGHRVKDDYVFEGDFADCRATLGDQTKPILEWDADTVAAAGETLRIKTIVDQISCDSEGYTNSRGTLTFSGLEDGLYLVWGDILKIGYTTYIPSAVFFEMNGEQAAVLNTYPKIVLYTLNENEVVYSVQKVWLNDEHQKWDRSTSITVERYRDNKYYDEIELNESNHWLYEWEDSDDHIWFVNEKIIPTNYTVAYRNTHTQYLIINTLDIPARDSSITEIVTETDDYFIATETDIETDTDSYHTESQTTSARSTDQTETDIVITDEKSQTDTETSAVTTESESVTRITSGTTRTTRTSSDRTDVTSSTGMTEEKAPQTGQLWWPVPLLASGGILLLGTGLFLLKKDDHS